MTHLSDITERDERGVCERCGTTMLDDGHGTAACYNPACQSKRVTLPQISLNGTSPQTLFNGYLAVRVAAIDLRMALRSHSPNARDYQYRPADFRIAAAEHEAHIARVEKIIADMDALAEHAQTAIDLRARR